MPAICTKMEIDNFRYPKSFLWKQAGSEGWSWPTVLPSARPCGTGREFQALRERIRRAGLKALHIESCARDNQAWQQAKAQKVPEWERPHRPEISDLPHSIPWEWPKDQEEDLAYLELPLGYPDSVFIFDLPGPVHCTM